MMLNVVTTLYLLSMNICSYHSSSNFVLAFISVHSTTHHQRRRHSSSSSSLSFVLSPKSIIYDKSSLELLNNNNDNLSATGRKIQLDEPTSNTSTFGRQSYWNEFYNETSTFSWYAGWDELEPFVMEFIDKSNHILIPGVGNDETLLHMYDAGYQYLTAMDYAADGIERCKQMLGENRILLLQQEQQQQQQHGSKEEETIELVQQQQRPKGVDLIVADARNLSGVFPQTSSSFSSSSSSSTTSSSSSSTTSSSSSSLVLFDAIIEKGTLDAIYLSGGDDKNKSYQYLEMAIIELGKTLKPGGTFMCITGVVIDQIQTIFNSLNEEWIPLVTNDEIYTTEDGYTSNNIDATLLVWKRRSE